ncbi:MAG: flagellar protein FliT [Burkholderiales bacterium]
MNSTQVIAAYEGIRIVTRKMLRAALDSDWDELVALEKKCRAIVENLIASEPHEPLSEKQQQRKIEIIRQVLADDAEIRNLTEPWLKQLQGLLSAAGHEKKLRQTYEAGDRV